MSVPLFERQPRSLFKRQIQVEYELSDHVLALAYAPRGSGLVSVPVTGAPCVLNASRKAAPLPLEGHAGDVLSVSWSPQGEYIVTGSQDGTVRIWHASTGRCEATLPLGKAWVERVAWSPEGSLIAATCGKHLTLLSARGERVQTFEPQSSTILGLEWLHNGKLLATCAYGNVSFFHPGEPEPMRHFTWKASFISLAWSPTGEYIVAGCQDGALHAWRSLDGEDFEMSGYPTKVRALSWDSSGRFLATGGGARPVIWDFSGSGPAGQEPMELPFHTTHVSGLAFRPGRLWLLVGAQEGGLSLWDLQKARQPLLWEGLSSTVTQLCWHPEGMQFALGLADGRVQSCHWR